MRFFTSDWHLDHANIIKYCNRPHACLEEMTYEIHARWNAVVAPTDTVYVLGDVTLGSVRPWGEFIRDLQGRKILIAGNHDACWIGHRRKARALRAVEKYLEAGFDAVIPEGQIYLTLGLSTPVLLSHLPYAGDSQDEDRYAEQRPVDHGYPNICGHVHEAWLRNGNSINVGVDVRDFTPVSEEQLLGEL